MKHKKKTVGQQIVEANQKKDYSQINVLELADAMLVELPPLIEKVHQEGKKIYTGDFYLVINTKLEPLLWKTFRNYVNHENTCPTPNYDQWVIKCSSYDDKMEEVWVIPNRDACQHMIDNAPLVQEKELLQYVIDYANGTLFVTCKILNGETKFEHNDIEKEFKGINVGGIH